MVMIEINKILVPSGGAKSSHSIINTLTFKKEKS